MTEPAPRIDFANLPAPTEGILVTLIINVRKVARSRDFYSRVLGGTVVLDEDPCIITPSNSWITPVCLELLDETHLAHMHAAEVRHAV